LRAATDPKLKEDLAIVRQESVAESIYVPKSLPGVTISKKPPLGPLNRVPTS